MLVAGVVICQVMPAGLSAQDIKWSPEHVYYGSGGKLVYTPDAQGNTIPDFSHVGYMYGDEAIPDVPTVVEVHPVEGDDASGYRAGDHIALYRPGTANWISDLKMDQIPDTDGSTKQWTPSSYSFYYERLVTKVSGDSNFFRVPVGINGRMECG